MPLRYHRTRRVDKELLRVVHNRRFYGRLGFLLLNDAWREAVGDMVADHTRPLKLTKKRLWLAVESSVWMNELQFFVPEMLEKLNARLGEGKVDEIRMKVADIHAPSSHTERAQVTLPEIDQMDRERAASITAKVRDEGLRERIRAAFERSLRLRKAQGESAALHLEDDEDDESA